ncbi:unnamed protein product [Leptidea sinapis]|uniref:Aminoacyl-transfer RNA synthetases class-II family profile domain-containing protein n=1 Tax=Leptidea sinapis TaxID=189913 RepID=A0A5E4Q8K2_9NEOP|nr:unnamed protein product [Leptidea sinapis]
MLLKVSCKLNNFLSIKHGIKKYYSVLASVLEKPELGENVEIKGWVKSLRVQKELVFADVSDGSCAQKLQVTIPKHLKTNDLTYGSAVNITGKLARSPRGQIELLAENVKIYGKCVVLDGYPFNPRTSHPPEYLRRYLHLRSRTNYISAMLRIRHSVTQLIHKYFSSKNYINIHTPIITSNDCEGAGEIFKVLPDNEETVKSMMQQGLNSETVYFGSKAFLTVSGQLHLEAVCRGMGNVYTFGPTFRAENSKSRLHLSEFYMLEGELAFCETLEHLQNIIEDFLKFILTEIRNSNEKDLNLIDKNNTTPTWLNKQFITLNYDEAKNILDKKGMNTAEVGINKEQELALVDYCNGVPVFIVRKFGNIPTGGFGLGLERLLQVICAIPNIKDTLPFPRWPHNCSM